MNIMNMMWFMGIIDSYYRWLFIHRDNKRNAAANKKGQSSKEG